MGPRGTGVRRGQVHLTQGKARRRCLGRQAAIGNRCNTCTFFFGPANCPKIVVGAEDGVMGHRTHVQEVVVVQCGLTVAHHHVHEFCCFGVLRVQPPLPKRTAGGWRMGREENCFAGGCDLIKKQTNANQR